MADKYLDAMALQYVDLKKDTFIALLFPCAVGKEDEVRAILNEHGVVVYEKQVTFTRLGAFNLINLIYEGEPWLGDWNNNFLGSRGKTRSCFPSGDNTIRVFLYESHDLNRVKEAKKKIRQLFNLGNHSIHINDTYEETQKIAQALFVANSIHFMNDADHQDFKRFNIMIKYYKQWLEDSGYDQDCFCIDGSAVLAAYGLRDCNDLDFLHHGYDGVATPSKYISSHNHELRYYTVGKDDIIFNPENHFYYQGLKLASLDVIKNMKMKRNEVKDNVDVQLIEQILYQANISGKTSTVEAEGRGMPISWAKVVGSWRVSTFE